MRQGLEEGAGFGAPASSVATLLSNAVTLLSSVEISLCCVATRVSRAVSLFSTLSGTGVGVLPDTGVGVRVGVDVVVGVGVACPDVGVGVTVGVSLAPDVGVTVGVDASGKPDTVSVKLPVASTS